MSVLKDLKALIKGAYFGGHFRKEYNLSNDSSQCNVLLL